MAAALNKATEATVKAMQEVKDAAEHEKAAQAEGVEAERQRAEAERKRQEEESERERVRNEEERQRQHGRGLELAVYGGCRAGAGQLHPGWRHQSGRSQNE